ncbi:LolA family protein [Candidatus Thiosymbion oneisti]|uniref:LolA family protein n=1 Tax=Candidatus Thiosymbion oneisti TaxID=589554 RepID=UPI00105C6091|nr:outer membrane lipoprotein carrier protein LolA [Candidatus Thiosymbion oneisti]
MQSIRNPVAPKGNIPYLAVSLRPIVSWLILPALLLCGPAPAATGPERLQDYLRGLRSLVSDFRQITLNVDGGRIVESKGTFYLRRPGQFRWEYESPVKQIIVADGKRVWLHDLELDQVSHQSQAKALGGTPAQLLAMEGPVDRHFKVTPWDAGDGREWVELRPKAKDTQVVRIRIGFAGKRLDTLLMDDSFGQHTRFVFTGTKRNPRLDKDLFHFDASSAVDFLQID